MKQKRFFLLGVLLGGVMGVCAQSSIVASGGNFSNSQGATVGVTVGQPAMETFSALSGSVLLGIQQDYSDVEFAIATNPIPNMTVEIGKKLEINLTEYFVSNETLSFSATSSDNGIVKPIMNGTMLSFELGELGTARIIVVAVAPNGQRFPSSFTVTVEENEPVSDATKEHLLTLYGNACTLINTTTIEDRMNNDMLDVEYQILVGLVNQAKTFLISSSATNLEVETFNLQLEQSMSNFIRLLEPTAVREVENEVQISVQGHTVSISNIHGNAVVIFDITGKRIYSCRNAETIQTTVKTMGTYIVMVGETKKSIVIK